MNDGAGRIAARNGDRVEFQSYMHATAICNMLERKLIRYARPSVQFVALLFVGVGGTIVGRLLHKRRYSWVRCLVSAILSALVVAAAFATAARYQILLSPVGAIVVIWVTVPGAACVARVWAAGGRRAEQQ
jgi:hypothetical protein